ncbi:unnamed protein product, partial [Pocillopora meandrina]
GRLKRNENNGVEAGWFKILATACLAVGVSREFTSNDMVLMNALPTDARCSWNSRRSLLHVYAQKTVISPQGNRPNCQNSFFNNGRPCGDQNLLISVANLTKDLNPSRPKAEEIFNMNLRPAGRFADCSETSISALLESFGVGTSFSNETHLSMEHENPMESFPNNFRVPQAFCVTPEITCLPSESATSLSESSKSSVTLQLIQETTFTKKEGRKIFDVQPQARYESFKDVPGSTCCTSCGIRVLTYTEYRVSSATWALAGCDPFMSSLQDTVREIYPSVNKGSIFCSQNYYEG